MAAAIRTLVAALQQMGSELTTMVRDIARGYVQGRKAELVQRIDVWLEANVEKMIEVAGKQMVEEALGAVKRRVLGRG